MSYFYTPPTTKAVLKGTTDPQLQRQVGRYSQNSGWVFDQQYRGFSLPKMEGLANEFAQAGCDFTLTWERGAATLETTDSRGTLSIDTWEVTHQESLISTFKNPRNIYNIPAADLALIAFAHNKGEDDITAATAAFNASTFLTMIYGTHSGTLSDAGYRLWERVFLFKEDSTFYGLYGVRHTTNVSNRWPYNIAEYNRQCIYTPAQFYNEAQDPDLWVFPMPQPFVNLLEASPVPSGPSSGMLNYGYFLWGFLKSGSPRITAANNTSNIVTEYKQFLWSTDEYSTL